jgi:peptidoglycan hydrolase-like protein with peptidoglycan-binding domain
MPAVSQTSDVLTPGAGVWKDDVRWAQVELRNAGLYNGSLDGVLGPQTKQALGAFQHKNGLARTASLDAQTWDALTGDSSIGQGSSTPSDTDRAGSPENSFGKSDSGR